jgi:hypothetical protein
MRKKILYTIIVLAICVGSTSFKQLCNDISKGTSYGKEIRPGVCPMQIQQEMNFSPIYNLLEI